MPTRGICFQFAHYKHFLVRDLIGKMMIPIQAADEQFELLTEVATKINFKMMMLIPHLSVCLSEVSPAIHVYIKSKLICDILMSKIYQGIPCELQRATTASYNFGVTSFMNKSDSRLSPNTEQNIRERPCTVPIPLKLTKELFSLLKKTWLYNFTMQTHPKSL